MKKTQSVIRIINLLRTAGLTLGWVSLALSPLASVGCNHKAEATSEEQNPIVEVETTYPKVMDLTREIDQPGFLRPWNKTPIYTKIAGIAKDWKVDNGYWVTKGDLMLELRVPEDEQTLLVRAAQVEKAEADLELARESAKAAEAGRESARAEIAAKLATIESAKAQVMRWQAEDVRARKLVITGTFDQQSADEIVNQLKASEAARDEATAKWTSAKATFDQAHAVFKKAEAEIKVAAASLSVSKSAYNHWRDTLAYRMITAPYDGVVTLRNVAPEDFLQPSNSGTTSKAADPIFIVMDTHIMRCSVDVPELDAPLVHKGDIAEIRLQAMPGIVFTGDVALKTEALDTRSRTLNIEIHMKNPASFKLNDKSFDNLRSAGVPEAVVSKLKDMKDKVLVREQFQAEVAKKLNKDELESFRALILTHANPKTELLPGMYANVAIKAKLLNAMTLPADAIESDILADGDRNFCYVVEDGKAHKTFLEVGARCDEGVQVLNKQRADGKWVPFTGTEAVVVDKKKNEDAAPSKLVGPKALRDGQQVKLRSAETPKK